MGIDINKTTFTPADYRQFAEALQDNLVALEGLLATEGFGEGAGSVGAELEMYIVDKDGYPLHLNQEICDAAEDPQLSLELNRYNLEYNLSPRTLGDSPFLGTEREILAKLAQLGELAATFGGRLVSIGILPTLRQADLGAHCVTDRKRYHALVGQLLRRCQQFRIDIDGVDPLQLDMADITLEGANTSFQLHYRVQPRHFADTFNAIQLMTPLALAMGGNSPTLFGHQLWQETRIPLFKQSIDTRQVDRYAWNEPARVNFGQGWVRRGALELFAEVVNLYPPLLPICAPRDGGEAGRAPSLAELRLHQSTVWLWNRPVYDCANGGHLRIEMRALPAGPTAVDMVANAAFLTGLAEGVRGDINRLLPAIPFAMAEYNFYRAAQHGIDAVLVWPDARQSGCDEQPVATIVERLLPTALKGLDSIGIDAAEAQYYLGVIERRLARRQTGASWQGAKLASLKQRMPMQVAQQGMLEEFIAYSHSNLPVSEWPL
ncbi:MAG: glutamate--cysteine ligase [Halioglobus sp.]|nr:glutamate--cysteine ligase [Halioglobus sp.]